MGTLYVDTAGATTNSGSTDNNAADITLTVHATYAGGATIQVTVNTGALTSIVTSGDAQSTVMFPDATNANQKIFWISGYDNVASPKTITVTTAPTGLTAGVSTGTIGGRFHLGATGTPANASIEGAVRAGDTVIFNNSPASQAAVIWTFRNAGTSAAGPCKIKGKTGTMPVFTVTNTSNVVSTNVALSWIENLEIVQQGASGSPVNFGASAAGAMLLNCKITDGGGAGITMAGTGQKVIGCSVSGVSGDAITATGAGPYLLLGNYVRNGSGSNGVSLSSASGVSINVSNVIAAAPARGIIFSGAPAGLASNHTFVGNTVYGCGNSGLEVSNANTLLAIMNNIFMNNGNAAGEANVDWAAGFAEAVSFHGWNTLYNNSGADAPINFTVNAQVPASELTTDPLFTNAATGDFSLQNGSPALNAGFPGVFPLGISSGYLALGAVQQAGQGVTSGDSALMITD